MSQKSRKLVFFLNEYLKAILQSLLGYPIATTRLATTVWSTFKDNSLGLDQPGVENETKVME